MDYIGLTFDAIKVRKCGLTKIRLGGQNDGGYVVYKELCEKSGTVYSFGIGDDVAFELAWAEQWPTTRFKLFDPFIDSLPIENPQFMFYKHGTGRNYMPISGAHQNSTLKMDVEWNEWDTFAAMPNAELDRYGQIIMEMHFVHAQVNNNLSPYFTQFYKEVYRRVNQDLFMKYYQVLDKLTKFFYIFHIHANNSLPLVSLDGHRFPPLLEVSLVGKDLAPNCIYDNGEFPVAGLDQPNKTDRPDLVNYYSGRRQYVQTKRTFEGGTQGDLQTIQGERRLPLWRDVLLR